MRARAVRADPMHDDIDRVGTGIRVTLFDGYLASGVAGRNVKREGIIRCAKTLPEFVFTHGTRANYTLLRGLHHQHQGSSPLILVRSHMTRGTNEARDVHIVSAGMHYKYLIAGNRVDLLRTGCIFEARLFFDRQAVHIGTHHDERTVAIFQHRHNARATDALSHVKARETEFHRHATCSLMLDRG